MYFNLVGENFLKAQVQNHYEKIRCDLYLKGVTQRHVHSLADINQGIKEVRDILKDIRSSSGHCNETAPKSNVWKEAGRSAGKNQPNGGHLGKGETQARSKNLEVSASKTTVGAARRRLFVEKNGGNVLEEMEYSVQGKKGTGGGDMNGDRSDIVPAGRLLRDEILTLADSRNVSDRQGTDPSASARNANIKGSQRKSTSSAHGGDFRRTTSTKPTTKNLGPLTSRTDIPLESARPNTAPRKAMSKGELKENQRSRYLSDADVKKVKIHVSLSKTERKKILQGLISSCMAPGDRSALERERQRRLQEKIHRFFDLLFEQDEKEDGSDISADQ